MKPQLQQRIADRANRLTQKVELFGGKQVSTDLLETYSAVMEAGERYSNTSRFAIYCILSGLDFCEVLTEIGGIAGCPDEVSADRARRIIYMHQCFNEMGQGRQR